MNYDERLKGIEIKFNARSAGERYLSERWLIERVKRLTEALEFIAKKDTCELEAYNLLIKVSRKALEEE